MENNVFQFDDRNARGPVLTYALPRLRGDRMPSGIATAAIGTFAHGSAA